MIAAAALIPLTPLGAKPPSAGLVQLDGRSRKSPTAMKNRMMPILRSTIALLVLADSLIPSTSTTVITATARNAGRLAMIGMPRRVAAVGVAGAKNAWAAWAAPPATAAAAIEAVRGSVASHAGISMPKWPT